jgi:hypothetical protein
VDWEGRSLIADMFRRVVFSRVLISACVMISCFDEVVEGMMNVRLAVIQLK